MKRTFYFRESGLGEDLMVFWAAVAAVLGGIIPPGLRLYFEKGETREFLIGLSKAFPEIEILPRVDNLSNVIFIRHTARLFQEKPFSQFLSIFLKSNTFCDPYYHKWLSEHGNIYKPSPWVSMAIAFGMLNVWRPPYEDTYDGWQQLGIALDLPYLTDKHINQMAAAWPLIRQRLVKHQAVNHDYDVLLFPSAGSSQHFTQKMIDQIKNAGDVRVVTFYQDSQEADIRYHTIQELADLISSTRLVITTDSLSSHIAQFFAHEHLLLTTRSRPGNVCFPGAEKTATIDLGVSLTCRPCLYTSHGLCAAGHQYCAAQQVGSEWETVIKSLLQ